MSSRISVVTCAFLVFACGDHQPNSRLSSASSRSASTPESAKPLDAPELLGFPWLKLGRHSAEVMTLAGSPEMEAMAGRLKEAFRRNRVWFEQYVAQHEGVALPWHPNMGLTPEEYQQFVQGQGTLAMHKQIDTTLVIDRDRADIAFSTGGKWKFFDDLRARIKNDASMGNTLLGALSRKVEITASEAQSVTGPWGGSCWRSSELTGLCLGKTQSGRGILTYEARTEDDTRPQANSDFVMLFELSPLP